MVRRTQSATEVGIDKQLWCILNNNFVHEWHDARASDVIAFLRATDAWSYNDSMEA